MSSAAIWHDVECGGYSADLPVWEQLAEPVGAMTWFPNNNTPRDKATFDMKITVPAKLEVAGSGDLKSVRKHAGKETCDGCSPTSRRRTWP